MQRGADVWLYSQQNNTDESPVVAQVSTVAGSELTSAVLELYINKTEVVGLNET